MNARRAGLWTSGLAVAVAVGMQLGFPNSAVAREHGSNSGPERSRFADRPRFTPIAPAQRPRFTPIAPGQRPRFTPIAPVVKPDCTPTPASNPQFTPIAPAVEPQQG